MARWLVQIEVVVGATTESEAWMEAQNIAAEVGGNVVSRPRLEAEVEEVNDAVPN